MRHIKCKHCGAELVCIGTRRGDYRLADPGLVPYRMDIFRGKDTIIRPNGDAVRCDLYPEDPEQITDVGYLPHYRSCPARRR